MSKSSLFKLIIYTLIVLFLPRILVDLTQDLLIGVLSLLLLLTGALMWIFLSLVLTRTPLVFRENSAVSEALTRSQLETAETVGRIVIVILMVAIYWSFFGKLIPDLIEYEGGTGTFAITSTITDISSSSTMVQITKDVVLGENSNNIQRLHSAYIPDDFKAEVVYEIRYLPRSKYVVSISEI